MGVVSSALTPVDIMNGIVLSEKPAVFGFMPPAEAEIDHVFAFHLCLAENEYPEKVWRKVVAFTCDRMSEESPNSVVIPQQTMCQ